MTTRLLLVAILLSGCGDSDDSRAKWLDAKLVPTTVEHDGVKLQVDLPHGLAENKDSVVGPFFGAMDSGPRVSLRVREEAFATPDAFARHVEPNAGRPDLVELSEDALAGGRLRYVSSTKNHRHLDVAVWIPLDAQRGVQAECHWYTPGEPNDKKTLDAKIVAWLTTICDSVRVAR